MGIKNKMPPEPPKYWTYTKTATGICLRKKKWTGTTADYTAFQIGNFWWKLEEAEKPKNAEEWRTFFGEPKAVVV